MLTVASIAKREEEIYLETRDEPIRAPRSSPALQLVQEIRDEAHRFAVTRHRKRRKKSTLRSRLDDIPGVGPKRKRQLLTRFGSAAGVAAASEDDLRPILGPKLAASVAELLRAGDEESETAAS